ncbi:uncharacterized protein LOC143293294 [Babylonia areolata]|uniref:uncharacterized protein LOC143293294 n=1 Tax=Babylonia areolata TaxID=304850 RepID=UPI003FD03203
MIPVKTQEVDVAPDHSRCVAHFSHLVYDDFGRTECFRHSKIAKIFEAGRQVAMVTILGFDSLLSERVTAFVLGTKYHMIPQLWTVRLGSVFPYTVSVEVSDTGRTSLTMYSEMVNKLNDQVLASCQCKFVLVDRETRRPAPFPDWYLQKYGAIAARNKRPLSLTRAVPEIPAAAHCYKMEVAASDTDFNGHVNQGSYMRFCCDAAQAALRAQTLAGFQHDIARYPLIEQEVIHIGESDMGDQLQVYVWQPPDRTDKVLFLITRHNPDGQPPVLYQAYMVFLMKQLALPHFARM